MKNLFIFGTSSTAKEILEIANQFYIKDFDSIKMLFFYNDSPQDLKQLELKPEDENFYIIGFADVALRELCINFMDGLFLKPFTIINPTAFIAPSSIIGEGCYIAANASISSDVKIGRHCIVNLNSSVGHDSKIDHNVLILPGANISGNCTIHEKTLVGSNAFIYQGITVGKNNSIDALTYIGKDLDDDMISISATTKSLKKMTP